ncbi:MAG: YceI family protein [Planctomycetota bacterium]
MKLTTALLAAAGLTMGGSLLTAVGLEDPTPRAAASAGADMYEVDGLHSSVVFRVGYMGVSNFYGRFNDVSGTYQLDFDNPSQSSIDITIDTASIDTNNEGRDKHLRGPDFFSAKEFPTISFTGTSFEAVDSNTIRVTGDMNVRGTTQEVTVDIDWIGDRPDPRGGYRSGIDTTLTIARSDFGVNYGVDVGVLGDNTDIMIGITGMKK